MNYSVENNNIILKSYENFNLFLTLDCGQCFRAVRLTDPADTSYTEYLTVVGRRLVFVAQRKRGELIFFTDKAQIYRVRVADFDISKPSQMGDYVPSKLSMDDDEHVVACKMIYDIVPDDHILYVFENGKGLRVKMESYVAKTRRRKITGAYSTESHLVGAIYESKEPKQVFIRSDAGKGMLIKSNLVPVKSTRTASGVQIMQLPQRGDVKVELVTDMIEALGQDALKCKKNALPSTGTSLAQLNLNF